VADLAHPVSRPQWDLCVGCLYNLRDVVPGDGMTRPPSPIGKFVDRSGCMKTIYNVLNNGPATIEMILKATKGICVERTVQNNLKLLKDSGVIEHVNVNGNMKKLVYRMKTR
jgi:hypothetical protein